jgi:hypothetical protein
VRTIHKSNGGFEFWDNEKEKVLDMYINKHMRTGQIAKEYNCRGGTILNHLKRWGISIRKERNNAIYTLTTDFFHIIDTEEKAYCLGLLLADGHLTNANHLMLTMSDVDIMYKYQKAIDTNIPIKRDKYGNYALNICSKEIGEDLRRIGFHNRKSYGIDISNVISVIPKNLMHHFVRGMFDGDGSIRIYMYDYIKNPQYHFGYTGTKEVVEFVYNYLGLHTKIVKESDITYTCVTSCKQTIKEIYEKLYKDATIYIARKRKTFLQII